MRETRRLLKSWQDRWSGGLQESESGLDRNDEHRACLSCKMEERKVEGREGGTWQREIYGKRKLEREREWRG